MKTLYLVSCVASKKSVPAPARDLYTSDWFKKVRSYKVRSYVEATWSPWFILSAEHGLLRPEQVVAPYEKTLNTLPIHERRAWSRRVFEQLQDVL